MKEQEEFHQVEMRTTIPEEYIFQVGDKVGTETQKKAESRLPGEKPSHTKGLGGAYGTLRGV